MKKQHLIRILSQIEDDKEIKIYAGGMTFSELKRISFEDESGGATIFMSNPPQAVGLNPRSNNIKGLVNG